MAADEWSVVLRASAERELSELPRAAQEEVFEILHLLREDSLPEGAVALEHYNNVYRLRFASGNFRLVYRVDQRHRSIEVFRIGPRSRVYRGFRSPG
ncbi:MAG: type II toxin-antitoxin system RelE/ParE family toxin [Acidobacteria bacterium]|nr:type II toxin-antitoxin system RelE/ParE family toxin [Acidobacteriota bacterium]